MLDELAALGPFFAVQAHAPTSEILAPWDSMAALVKDPQVLSNRVESVRSYLAAGSGRTSQELELRVAASVTHLGLAARLLSPALAMAVLHGTVLPWRLDRLRWQQVPGGMFPLSIALGQGHIGDVQTLADGLSDDVLHGALKDIELMVAEMSVSARVLRGNVASAVNGAVGALASARPECAPRARLLASALLERPPLLGSATHDGTGHGFRRRSCCLIYRAAPTGARAVCGDCVLGRG
ncbi:(2Fe-2S)-binding protein [Streptacidiphilus sp. PB12-B1b]|nr:(2Fe-2S)-binding protein [Streptacidiphilus sp. PB12-B1b]